MAVQKESRYAWINIWIRRLRGNDNRKIYLFLVAGELKAGIIAINGEKFNGRGAKGNFF